MPKGFSQTAVLIIILGSILSVIVVAKILVNNPTTTKHQTSESASSSIASSTPVPEETKNGECNLTKSGPPENFMETNSGYKKLKLDEYKINLTYPDNFDINIDTWADHNCVFGYVEIASGSPAEWTGSTYYMYINIGKGSKTVDQLYQEAKKDLYDYDFSNGKPENDITNQINIGDKTCIKWSVDTPPTQISTGREIWYFCPNNGYTYTMHISTDITNKNSKTLRDFEKVAESIEFLN